RTARGVGARDEMVADAGAGSSRSAPMAGRLQPHGTGQRRRDLGARDHPVLPAQAASRNPLPLPSEKRERLAQRPGTVIPVRSFTTIVPTTLSQSSCESLSQTSQKFTIPAVATLKTAITGFAMNSRKKLVPNPAALASRSFTIRIPNKN